MLTSHEILGFMSPKLAMEIFSYAHESDKPLYQTTLAAVAEARHLRPAYLKRQPREQQHSAMLATLTRPSLETVAATLLRTWLLKKHNAMLVDFLNALEIPHKEGVVEDNLPETMDEAKFRVAVDALVAKYPAEIVAVYLNAFAEMNEVDWPVLKTKLAKVLGCLVTVDA